MFSTEFLNKLRAYEIESYLPYLDKQQLLLELGGGTGEQARQLSERGYAVTSVDIENSTYSENRVFPVQDYDGEHLPFDDNSFGIIFSSNVLEHIPHLDQFHSELKRVLKEDGYCIHIMPTGSWRFWTSGANYIELLQRLGLTAYKSLPRSLHPRQIINSLVWGLRESVGLLRAYWMPPRHGEEGNAWTEICTFSKWRWRRHFLRNDYEMMEVKPLGLFYTGHMIFGSKWPMAWRRIMARLLGSACVLYKVRPRQA